MYITPLTILAICIRIYDPPTVALCIKKTTIPIFINLLKACKRLGKSKIKPRTGHVIPEGEEMYSSTLSLTLAVDWEWVVNATPWLLYPWGKRHGTHCKGDWEGASADLDRCRISPSPCAAYSKSLYQICYPGPF